VALNYRLGALGWLSGPTFQTDGVANAGLLDQRFALHWIQKHIASFGGDPDQVTVMGESAGGGSIMHQITVSKTSMLEHKEPTLTFVGVRWKLCERW
jgi:carboxylesterase type B